MARDVERDPLPGGQVPDPGELFQDTIAEFMDDPMPYLLAGFGQAVVVFPLLMMLFVAVYVGLFLGLFGGTIAGVLVSLLVQEVMGEALASLALVATQLLAWGFMMALFVGAALAMGLVIAPMQASLTRRIAEHQRGGRKLDFMASFTDLRRDLGSVLGVALLYTTAILLGAMACYVPALIVGVLLTWSTTFVALHRMGPVRALTTSAGQVMDQFSFHGLFALIYVVLSMVAGYLPVAGPMFVMALHVRAYRTVFGDQEQPVLRPAAP